MSTENQSFVDRRAGDTWINAILGAVVAVLLSFTVIGGIVSTLAGGAVAGYLQGSTRTAGAKVGALSGLIASLPVFGVVFVVLSFLGIGLLGGGSDAALGIGIAGFVVVLIVAVILLFTVALAAIGGYLGAMLAENRSTTGGRGPEYTQVDSSSDVDSSGTDSEPSD